MWPKRPKRPRVARSEYSAFLRGRLCGLALGLGDPEEPDLYADEEVPLRLRVAFTIGATSKRRAPILSEAALRRKVDELVDLAEMVAGVEVGELPAILAQVESDDPGSSTPPAAPPPAGVGVEETARLHTTRWIGDPLPPTVS